MLARLLRRCLAATVFALILLPELSLAQMTVATNFEALLDNNTVYPPDTMGAAGPNHLMVTLNSQVRIQDKSGTALATVGLKAWWQAGLGGSVTDAFDPKIIYDSISGHFVFIAAANRRSASSGLLLGVSVTSDPTGSWSMWLLPADEANTIWVDYPSVGVNKNWIVVTANMFTNAGDAFSGVNVWMIDKSTAYAGAVNPTYTLNMKTGLGSSLYPALTYDANLETLHLVSTYSSPYLRLYSVTGAPAAPVFNTGDYVSVSAWDGGFTDAPQAGTSIVIATNDDRMHNVVVRDGKIWCTHHVGLPSSGATHTAIRWYEIDPQTPLLRQQGTIDTYATDGVWYYFPSLAVNKNNDMAIGFTGSSSAKYAGCYCSYHTSTMSSGQASAPQVFKVGLGTYTRGRWGDYSMTMVDPADDTNFWTIQEYAAGSDLWGAWWAKIIHGGSVLDILWRNRTSGVNGVWHMNGANLLNYDNLDTDVSNTNWIMNGAADFDGDGFDELIWRNYANGANVLWFMSQTVLSTYRSLDSVVDSRWYIGGAGDFNNDGNTDILWRYSKNGGNAIWFMNGHTLQTWRLIDFVPNASWVMSGAGDFNHDGETDILWRYYQNGANAIWFMNGYTLQTWELLDSVRDTAWRVGGLGDINADGNVDILWRRGDTGQNVVWLMNGKTLVTWQSLNSAGVAWYIGGVGNL